MSTRTNLSEIPLTAEQRAEIQTILDGKGVLPVVFSGTILQRVSQDKPDNRLVVIEHLMHQVHGENPTGVQTRFTRILKSSEKKYQISKRVGINWIPIELGWVKDPPSMVHIENLDKKTILVIGMLGDGEKVTSVLQVWPNEAVRIHPVDALRLRFASAGPLEVDFITTVYPS